MLEGSIVKSKTKKDKRNKIKKNSTLNLVVRRKPTISAREDKYSNN